LIFSQRNQRPVPPIFSLRSFRYQTVRDDDDDNEPNIHMLGLSYKFKF
jgi:hypothetical protein